MGRLAYQSRIDLILNSQLIGYIFNPCWPANPQIQTKQSSVYSQGGSDAEA